MLRGSSAILKCSTVCGASRATASLDHLLYRFNALDLSVKKTTAISSSSKPTPFLNQYQIQRRHYATRSKRRYNNQKDLDHLNKHGRIKSSILKARWELLEDKGLLCNVQELNDRKVYGNFHLYEPWQKDINGLTNLQRMQNGNCPISLKGNDLVVIHHFDQTHAGDWVILEDGFHKKYHNELHSDVSLILGVRRNAFTRERQAYWKLKNRLIIDGNIV